MALTGFAVVHARGDAAIGDPLVHAYAERQLVLSYISRVALEDYFQVPGDVAISLQQWNLVVDSNLDAFSEIIRTKFEQDDWEVYNAHGQSYPKLVVTLDDIRLSGRDLTIEVLNLDAGFRPR